jgi:hypothetical protein
MKGSKFFLYAVLMAVLAGVVTLATWQMNGFLVQSSTPLTYITFVGWAAYFLIGADVKSAVLAAGSAVAGIVAAIFMFVLAIAFGFAPWWAVPVGVIIVVPFMIYCEKVKPISNTSIIFMSTGLYFSLAAAGALPAFTPATYAMAGIAELVYMIIGFIAGWLSIKIVGLCSTPSEGAKTE